MANFGPTQCDGDWNNISFEPFSLVQNTKVHSNYSSKSSKEAWLNQYTFATRTYHLIRNWNVEWGLICLSDQVPSQNAKVWLYLQCTRFYDLGVVVQVFRELRSNTAQIICPSDWAPGAWQSAWQASVTSTLSLWVTETRTHPPVALGINEASQWWSCVQVRKNECMPGEFQIHIKCQQTDSLWLSAWIKLGEIRKYRFPNEKLSVHGQ